MDHPRAVLRLYQKLLGKQNVSKSLMFELDLNPQQLSTFLLSFLAAKGVKRLPAQCVVSVQVLSREQLSFIRQAAHLSSL